MESLSSLKPLIIPRCYSPDTSQPTAIDLHVFGDASEPGFGAVAYLLFVYSDKCQNRVREGQISCLSAAVCLYSTLGAVRRFARRSAQRNYQERAAFTDPTVRLLVKFDDRDQPDFFQELQICLHIYVANRVGEILETMEPAQWKYVPTDLNPAEDCTRGLEASQLTPDHRYLAGPARDGRNLAPFTWQNSASQGRRRRIPLGWSSATGRRRTSQCLQ